MTEVKNNRHTKCLFDDALSLGELVNFHSSDKFPLPDIYVRESLLKVHCKNLFLSEDLNLVDIAKITNGTTGADLSVISQFFGNLRYLDLSALNRLLLPS